MTELFYKAAGAVVAPFRYAEREAKALKEHVKEDVQAYLASMLKLVAAGVAGFMFLLFISITAAHAINNGTGSNVAGYAIVAGFYLLVAAFVYILKMSEDKKKKEKSEELHRRTISGSGTANGNGAAHGTGISNGNGMRTNLSR